MIDPSRVRISDALEPFAAGFAAELDVADFPCHAERFLQARRDAGYKFLWTSRALRPLLMYLQGRGATRPGPHISTGPVDEALARYGQYLIVERGLSERTVGGYVYAVRPFLRRCISSDGLALDIDQLSEADVTAFMVAQCAGGMEKPQQRAQRGCGQLRDPARALCPRRTAYAPLSEIQDFLRHARMQTTAIYAKVDRDALRTIARPWSGGVA